jgi:hypothetical protein
MRLRAYLTLEMELGKLDPTRQVQRLFLALSTSQSYFKPRCRLLQNPPLFFFLVSLNNIALLHIRTPCGSLNAAQVLGSTVLAL